MKPASKGVRSGQHKSNVKATDLKLSGSQVNLSHRQESPRSIKSTLGYNVPRCPTHNHSHCHKHRHWRRPVSADQGAQVIPQQFHHNSSHSLNDLTQTKPRYFCGNSHNDRRGSADLTKPNCPSCKGSVCSLSCRVSRRLDLNEDVDYVPGREDPFRHTYTAQSANLLKTLLREPWKSDSSEGSSSPIDNGYRPAISTKTDATVTDSFTPHSGIVASKSSIRDAEVDLKFERWFLTREKKDVRFSLNDPNKVDHMENQRRVQPSTDGFKTEEKTDTTFEVNKESTYNAKDDPSDLFLDTSSNKDEHFFDKSKPYWSKDTPSMDSKIVTNLELITFDSPPSRDCAPQQGDGTKPLPRDNGVDIKECSGSTTSREEPTKEVRSSSSRSDGTVKDSTYDDIVSILQVLESEETEPLLGETNQCSTGVISARPEGKHANEIFDYLDQVERCTDAVVKPAYRVHNPINTTTTTALPELQSAGMPRLDELLCRNTVDLAQEVLSLRLQAEEQNSAIKLLQQTIAELKSAAKEAKEAHRAEMDKATADSEAAVSRHQKMVKQLLAEKKSLNEKIAKLVEDLKSSEERHQRNLKTMEERHLVEVQRVKETQAAAEKLKREKWIDVKTQKIKEMTVKGLEPELSRMEARQQQELAELRSLHRSELEAVELRAARRTTELMDQLRVELARDKEDAIQREAATQRARWEKQLEEEQRRYEEEIRRLKEDTRREKDRIALIEVQFQESLAEAKRINDRERERERGSIIREWEEKLEDAQRIHQSELKNLKESLEMEKDIWMNNYKKIQTNKFLEREAELHHQYKRERDRDIEIAIDRIETEAEKAKAELQEAAENRLKRLRDKLEAELNDAEAEIRSLKTKLTDAKYQFATKEDQVAELESQLRFNQSELQQVKRLCEEMSAERADLKKTIRAELSEELTSVQASVETVKEEMAALKASHIVEMERKDAAILSCKAEAERELQQVYHRVRITISKKDDALETLKEQYKVVLERCSHLEQMLDNQRRNLLLK